MRVLLVSFLIVLSTVSIATPVLSLDEVLERTVPNAPMMQSTIPTVPTQTMDQKVALLQQEVLALTVTRANPTAMMTARESVRFTSRILPS